MQKKTGASKETCEQKIKLTIEFPEKSSKDECIKNEVKEILKSVLQEQLGFRNKEML